MRQDGPSPPEDATLARMRAGLLWLAAAAMAGTGLELLFLGHVESLTQMLPVVLLAGGLMVLTWHVAAASVLTVRIVQLTMALFVFTGALGVGLHYSGNEEFELEMYPTRRGFELVQEVLTGATPVLAPGSMTLIGLIGLAHTFRHPRLASRQSAAVLQEERS